MFEKVVLATDLSPAWEEIVACAGEFRTLGCAQVILTHVITVKFLGGLEASWRAEAQPLLEAQKSRLEAQGLQVAVEMPMGLPAYSLNEVAGRHGADLIVVGSHGKSLWREGVLGCVSCALLHHALYPVLLLNVQVKEGMAEGTCRLQATELLRHVLFPTDFSEIAQGAFDCLENLASKGMAQVTLLHVLEAAGSPGAEARAQDSLAATQGRLKEAGVPQVDTQLSQGHPIPGILELLRSQDFSLIIMGTQGRGFIKEIFLGSVAHNVSRQAPCPVLLIPPLRR
jgi:nucleotide-binding universal stress UspA family protein